MDPYVMPQTAEDMARTMTEGMKGLGTGFWAHHTYTDYPEGNWTFITIQGTSLGVDGHEVEVQITYRPEVAHDVNPDAEQELITNYAWVARTLEGYFESDGTIVRGGTANMAGLHVVIQVSTSDKKYVYSVEHKSVLPIGSF